MKGEKKLWGGRFRAALDPRLEKFNRSFPVDRRLLFADLRASTAHARQLERFGVLTASEAKRLVEGLAQCGEAARADERILDASRSEDVHSFIEEWLTERLGDLAKKLHTGRSRNDQVATAFRLWLREASSSCLTHLHALQGEYLRLAEAGRDAILPGYTHLQRAQPILWAHWCLAYFEMLERDRERLKDARRRLNVLPLGSGALAGSPYYRDGEREKVAAELGFEGISRNSLDAVSDRDFAIETVSACALCAMHLSRCCEDLILFSSAEFGFVELSDTVTTGSSLMPQKKNPDILELVRGQTGKVYGHLVSLLTLLKGLPLAYNKDLQEDKQAVFDAIDTTLASTSALAITLAATTPRPDRMRFAAGQSHSSATDLADYLVERGVPFREAHEIVGKMVVLATSLGVELGELPLARMQELSPVIQADVAGRVSLQSCLEAKRSPGGTSPARVREALEGAKRRWQADKT